jgi:hypothetical protein
MAAGYLMYAGERSHSHHVRTWRARFVFRMSITFAILAACVSDLTVD